MWGNPIEVDLVLDQVDAEPPAPPPATSARLRDTEWMLIELDGRPVPPPVEGGRAPTIVFATEGSAFSAQGQCNRHFGTFEADDAAGTLAIRMVGSTRMGCPDEVMKEEAGFLAAIGRVATFRIEGEMLTLEGGNAVTRFAAAFANK
jgi:putative lipoprotein